MTKPDHYREAKQCTTCGHYRDMMAGVTYPRSAPIEKRFYCRKHDFFLLYNMRLLMDVCNDWHGSEDE